MMLGISLLDPALRQHIRNAQLHCYQHGKVASLAFLIPPDGAIRLGNNQQADSMPCNTCSKQGRISHNSAYLMKKEDATKAVTLRLISRKTTTNRYAVRYVDLPHSKWLWPHRNSLPLRVTSYRLRVVCEHHGRARNSEGAFIGFKTAITVLYELLFLRILPLKSMPFRM